MFDSVADAYDAGRPTYPDELYRALSEVSGVGLDGATAVDVGAGTGILTHALRARGSQVIAVDPGAEMLARLRSRAAGQAPAAVAAVLADGNALPLAGGVADLVTYAQSWHWLDPVASIAEARRVLRPGGAIAGCWNLTHAAQAEWLAAYERRLAGSCPATGGRRWRSGRCRRSRRRWSWSRSAGSRGPGWSRSRLPGGPALALLHGGAVA